MSYRVDFWITAVSSFAIQLGVAYFVWLAVFDATDASSIGGFTFDGMVLYYVMVLLTGKLVRGQERDLPIATDIYEGGLTRYLIYPTSYGGFKYAEHLGALVPSLIQTFCFGLIAVWWLPQVPEIGISAGSIARALVAMAMANLLAFLVRFPIQAVAFWADNVWSLNVMLRMVTDLLGGRLLPLALFPAVFERLLGWLPFSYLFSFPVLTLIGKVSVEEWWQGLGIMLLWMVLLGSVGAAVWRRGQETYTGVGI